MTADEHTTDAGGGPQKPQDEQPPNHIVALPIPEFITKECYLCHGTGQWTPPQNPTDYLAGKVSQPETCPGCGGSGKFTTVKG